MQKKKLSKAFVQIPIKSYEAIRNACLHHFESLWMDFFRNVIIFLIFNLSIMKTSYVTTQEMVVIRGLLRERQFISAPIK